MVKNISVLFSTSRSIKPWHFCRCECRLPRGTHHLRCSQQPVPRGDSQSPVASEQPCHQYIYRWSNILSSVRTTISWTDLWQKPWHGSRPSWWTLRLRGRTPPPPLPSAVSSSPPPVRSVIRVAAEGHGFHFDPPSGPHTPAASRSQTPDQWSITGERSLSVCLGRAPWRGSVWSSQSSRCVSDISGLSQISVPGFRGPPCPFYAGLGRESHTYTGCSAS